MGHDADDVAVLVAYPGDVVRRAVRVFQVAEHYAVVGLDLLEHHGVGEVVARVAEERAGQEVGLGEHLEAVADTQDGAAGAGEVLERGHHLGEAGYGAGTQVVAVGEAAGYDHGVRAFQICVGVPELDRLGTHPLDGVESVPVAVGAGKDRDPYPHRTTSHSYSSIVGFASRCVHIASTASALSTSISMSLPTWTVPTPLKPRAGSALRTASPWGSRMPDFGRTRMRTFNLRRPAA